MKRLLIYIYALMALLMASCTGDNRQAAALLLQADSLMDEQPDSALHLLESHLADKDAWPHAQRMRYELLRAKAMNKAYVPFTTDSVMLQVADYYDDGDPNDAMLAHYLLGCVYRDLGEAPAAIEAYLDAASRVDTTASNCDYHTLSRVYGQMSTVYNQQRLMSEYLESLKLSEYYAWEDRDTMQALNAKAYMISAYELSGQYDTVISRFDSLYSLLVKYLGKELAAMYCVLPVKSLLEKGNIESATKYLDLYRYHSGFFDSSGKIEKGREVYYYYRGLCFLYNCQYDSANYYFSKELHDGKDFNNQNAASLGLALNYQRLNQPDSSAKYALYSYEMNDSVYARMATEEVERAKAMYNYNRNKVQAEKKENEASRMRQLFLLVSSLSLVALLSLLMGIVVYRKKKQMQLVRYQHLLSNLEQAQSHLQELLSDEQQLSASTIRKLTDEVAYWKHKVEENRKVTLVSKSSINKTLEKSNIVARMRQMLEKNPPETVSVSDIKELKNLINEVIPTFYDSLNTPDCVLRPVEYEVCLLIRVFFSPAEICKLMDRSDAYISNLRRRILKKRYGIEGAPKELDALILNIL